MSESPEAKLLDDAAELLERAVLEAPLSQGERAYLGSTATRLHGLASQLRDGTPAAIPDEPEDVPKPPRRVYTRKQAAELIGCHSNTLIRWEERGLLTARRDHRGWRVYGREELARAMALAAHIPVE